MEHGRRRRNVQGDGVADPRTHAARISFDPAVRGDRDPPCRGAWTSVLLQHPVRGRPTRPPRGRPPPRQAAQRHRRGDKCGKQHPPTPPSSGARPRGHLASSRACARLTHIRQLPRLRSPATDGVGGDRRPRRKSQDADADPVRLLHRAVRGTPTRRRPSPPGPRGLECKVERAERDVLGGEWFGLRDPTGRDAIAQPSHREPWIPELVGTHGTWKGG